MKLLPQLALFLALTLPGSGQIESKPLPRKNPGTTNPSKTRTEALSRADDLAAKRKARIDEARKNATAKAEAKKKADEPKPAKLALPEESAPKEQFSGKWLLQTSSLGNSITEQMQKSAGKQAEFKLGEITGDYLAEVNSEENKITVHWNDWKMESVATRKDGEIKMSVSVNGRQEYRIVKLTHGDKPEAREIELKILNDYTKSQTLFQGIKIKSKVSLPTLSDGHWSIHEGHLHLQGTFQKEPWKFARKTDE